MRIKIKRKDDFIDFIKKHTHDATVFYFDNADTTKEGFVVCDSRYAIIYQCNNHDERNEIIDLFNNRNCSYPINNPINLIVYNQDLPNHDFVL